MRSFLVFMTFCCELLGAEPMLRVRPHVVVIPGSEVKLAQLIDGQELSAELLSALQDVTLSVAPEKNEKQEFTNANLTSLLRPLIQAERTRSQAPLHVVVPKVVVIDTGKRELRRDNVTSEILQTWQPLCADCILEIENLTLPGIVAIRDWTLRLKAELPRGSFSMPIELIRENGLATSAWISGRLIIKKNVPVALRALNLGERVSEKDFAWEYRDITFSIDGIPTIEDLPGKHMKQGLRVADIVFKGMLEKEKAIRAGDNVQLKSAEGIWEVTLNVIAQQDAYIGDVINLRNPKNNSVLIGQVTGHGEAELR